MDTLADAAVRDARGAVFGVLFCRYAVRFASVWLLIWGLGVLVLRSGLDVAREALLWGGVGVPAAMLLATVAALRGTPAPAAVRAWLDRYNGVGGLLMAEGDADLGQWDERLPKLSAPRVRWRGGRTWLLFAVALAFVAGMFVMPQFFTAPLTDPPLQVNESISRLHGQITTLNRERIIDDAEARKLSEQLDQVKQEASGRDPVKTWEAMDHMEKTIARPAESAAELDLRRTESLTRTEAMAGALTLARDAMDAKLLAAAMAQMGEMAKESLHEKLPDDLAKALDSRTLDDATLKKLAEMLRDSKLDLREQLRRLEQARLIDPAALKMCDKLGKVQDREGLARYLCEAGDEDPRDKVALWCQGQRPGRGGITRGRGDAPIQFGDASTDEGAKFKPQILPPAALGDNRLVGTSAAAPDDDKKKGPSNAGALRGAAAGGGAAVTHTVLPRYRGTIDRYFDRPRKADAPGTGAAPASQTRQEK
jgi:hypothetical protein